MFEILNFQISVHYFDRALMNQRFYMPTLTADTLEYLMCILQSFFLDLFKWYTYDINILLKFPSLSLKHCI